MAVTQISDIISESQFQTEALNGSLRLSALYETGAMVQDGEISRLASANVGTVFDFNYFNDLDDTEAGVSSDNPATLGTAGAITTSSERAVKCMRAKGWGSANLASAMSATGKPYATILTRISAYWGRQYDITGLSILKGIIADNIASDASDMVNDISGELAAADKVVSFNAIIDTKQTMGDHQDGLSIALAHSAVKSRLVKDQVANKVYDASGTLLYEEIAGLRIVTRDTVPNNAGVYDTILMAGGAMGIGFGAPEIQEEEESTASAGNGEGVRTVWSRRHFAIHPYGFSYTGAKGAGFVGESPTNTELENATYWSRVKERKAIKLAVLRSTATV